jgi:transposase
MAEVRRKFDEDFKQGAVRLVREIGKPIAQVAGSWASTRARWATGAPGTGGSAETTAAR